MSYLDNSRGEGAPGAESGSRPPAEGRGDEIEMLLQQGQYEKAIALLDQVTDKTTQDALRADLEGRLNTL